MMPRPNLFVIGAMKSGTKYLNRLLNSHPEIFMCRPEEPSYFVEPAQLESLWPWMWEQGYWRSEERYLDLFEQAADAKWIGDGSTAYTKLKRVTGVPQRIAEYAPDPRFIYLIRDPVKRTLSHYWWAADREGEARGLLVALRDDPFYREVSHYAMQLRAYLEVFDRAQIVVVSSEELFREPQVVLHRIWDWLGIDSTFVAGDTERPENVSPLHVHQPTGHGRLHRFRTSHLWARLSPHTPAFVRRVGNALAYRDVDRTHVDLSEAIAFLRPLQQEQTEELAELLGRSFPEWTTLYGAE